MKAFRAVFLLTASYNPATAAAEGAFATALVSVHDPRCAPMFARFCRADSLVIEGAAGDVDDAVAGTPHSERAVPLALGRPTNGSVVAGLQRLVLRGIAVRVKDVKDAARAFPNLSEFVLFNSVVTEDDLALAAWEFGPRLQKLRFKGASGPQWGRQLPIGFCRRPSAASSRSEAPPSIRAMINLQVLCLQKQPRLTSRTFSHLAAIPFLGSLCVDRSKFSDDDAKILSHLTALERLSVGGCGNLSQKCLLRYRRLCVSSILTGSGVLRKSTPVDAFESASPVITGRILFLLARKAVLDSWRQLSGCSFLKKICMHNCSDTDLHAAEAFASCSSITVVHAHGSPVASAAFGALLRERKQK